MTLNDWRKIVLTDTMADLVTEFNKNSDDGALVDSLLSYTVDTGVFRTGNEKVNTTSIGPHVNVTIPAANLTHIQFNGFMFYFSKIHKVFTDAFEVDLSTYNDSKLHLLYMKCEVINDTVHNTIQYNLSPVILDELYTGNDDYLLLSRFIITTNALQFYVCTRNAGTNPFDKAGVKYEVLSGIQPETIEALKLHITSGKIKYSGINISSVTDPDLLVETFESTDEAVIRYITKDNEVDWTANALSSIITNKKIDYTSKVISDVEENKFTCQKVYYDYMTRNFIIQYGAVVYDSKNEALTGASNFNYEDPDYVDSYIPVAILIVKSGLTDLVGSDDFAIINITDASSLSSGTATDPTARTVANNALAAAQAAQTTADIGVTKADAAQVDATSGINKADAAQADADTANTSITDHLADTNNPHNVTKSQVGLSNVDNVADESKPLSTPQKEYVDGKVTELNTSIATKATNATQTKCVVKSSQPTSADYGRNPIKGDLWLIP